MDGTHPSPPAPTPDGPATWEWTVTSDRVAYSAGWHALLGESRAATLESLHAWLGRVHPDDIGAVMQALDRHLGGESPVNLARGRARGRSRHGDRRVEMRAPFVLTPSA